MLSNGFRCPRTFKTLKGPKIEKDRTRLNSVELIEMQLLRKILNKTELIARNLVIYTLLTLSIYTIRSNSIKWFNMNKPQKLALRQQLIKHGQIYYDYCLHYLQLILSSLVSPEQKLKCNVELSILVSELLNKVSIYEFNNLNNSLIFSKGLISIFEEFLVKAYTTNLMLSDNLSHEVKLIFMFLNFASKSINFPRYDYRLLYEFQDILASFYYHVTTAGDHYDFNSSLRFSLNHLISYTNDLILLFENNSLNTIERDFHLLYRLLRAWLSNLPTSTPLFNYLQNPVEIIIMKLYNTMAHILNNLFPQVNFLYLSTFNGNIQFFHSPYYRVKKFNWEEEIFSSIDYYCNRVSTFFLKRYNVLSVMYNNLTYANEYSTLNYRNRITDSLIRLRINEIPISNFNNTQIRQYHYVHIPSEVTFADIRVSNKDIIEAAFKYKSRKVAFETLKLFSYNSFHELIIKNNFINFLQLQGLDLNFEEIEVDASKGSEEEEIDPVFQHNLANFGGNLSVIASRQHRSRSQSRSQTKSKSPDLKSPTNIKSANVSEESTMLQGPELKQPTSQEIINNNFEIAPFKYKLFSKFIYYNRLKSNLCKDYFQLLTNDTPPLKNPQMDHERGLDVEDHDPKDTLNCPDFMFVFNDKKVLQDFNVNEFLIRFNQLKNRSVSSSDELDDEGDMTDKFYDDMNDAYFQ